MYDPIKRYREHNELLEMRDRSQKCGRKGRQKYAQFLQQQMRRALRHGKRQHIQTELDF
jgi:hypothetical protein